MATGISDEEFDWRISSFQLPAGWEQHCTPKEPTKTPGVFYHGSPNPNIRRLETSPAVFFTHNPSYAALYASKDGSGGRIYRAELVTKRPFIVTNSHNWSTAVGLDADAEAEWIAEARACGFDSIISLKCGSTITEIIVLQDGVIRPIDRLVGNLTDYGKCDPRDYLSAFHASGKADYAPDMAMLLGNPRKAQLVNGAAKRVATRPTCPVYCDQAVWRAFDFGVLRWLEIDCLIDPCTGNALVFDPDRIFPVTRNMARSLAAKSRRWATACL